MKKETIFSPVNGYTKSAISIMRVSGPKTKEILFSLCKNDIFEGKINYTEVYDLSNKIIDKCIVLYFPKPKSPTGEDLAEFQVHGSYSVLKSLEKSINTFDSVRRAEKGEFTKQAFLNNKMDLAQIEGLGDLLDSITEKQRLQAHNAFLGGVSSQINNWRRSLIDLCAIIESLIDFSDENLPTKTTEVFSVNIKNLIAEMENALKLSEKAKRVREGLKIVITGPPNAGKSSLINAIVNQDVSIVNVKAGTTRDIISANIDLDGVQATLYDTAGLQKSNEEIEIEGINRAKKLAKISEIQIKLVDGSQKNWKNELRKIPSLGIIVINVVNKIDLIKEIKCSDVLNLSVKTKKGLSFLIEKLIHHSRELTEYVDLPIILRERHQEATFNAKEALERVKLIDIIKDPELIAEELRLSLSLIGKITGTVGVEDVLDSIFSQFCIGK